MDMGVAYPTKPDTDFITQSWTGGFIDCEKVFDRVD